MAPLPRRARGRRDRPRNSRRGRRLRRRRRGTGKAGAAKRSAESRLGHYRQATIVSVALTGLLLLLFSPDEAGVAQDAGQAVAADSLADLPDTVSIIQQVPLEEIRGDTVESEVPDSLAQQGTEEATETLREIWLDFYGLLPKLGIALGILLLAWVLSRVLRPLLRWGLRSWNRANAITALVSIALWLLAFGIALSVITGDFRALVGSLGLVGLALSWALQTPIESFTAWLLNSFRGYYRVGDRVAVGEVYGDVYRIDVLTTTVWEYGGPDRLNLHVHGEQPTGRLITFPNNELLTGSIINMTRDFPFVWDEVSLEFSSDSDVNYLLATMKRVAREVLGDYMREPARKYEQVLQREGLEASISEEPQVFLGISEDGWLEATIRYLVGARERRVWKTRLVEAVMIELQTREGKERIKSALPKRLVQFLDEQGRPVSPGNLEP